MILRTLWLGLCRKCPQCGKEPIYQSWAKLIPSCPQCHNAIRSREPDTWFFMYMSTAAITGVFITFMVFFRPASHDFARFVIGVLAFLFIVCTIPQRKGMAIAIDWLIENKMSENGSPK